MIKENTEVNLVQVLQNQRITALTWKVQGSNFKCTGSARGDDHGLWFHNIQKIKVFCGSN